jgi:flagellar biosynthesis/type III secretory pathway protein FliH
MTELLKLPLLEAPRGLRLHAERKPDGGTSAKVSWLLGLGEAQARRIAEHKALLQMVQSLQRTMLTLPAVVTARLDQIAAMAVELGLAVAREVVGDALARGHVDPTPVVARCLREAVHGSTAADLVVHLHPDDLAPVMDRVARDPELQAQFAAATLRPDPQQPRGSVHAVTGAGSLTWEPLHVLERLAEELRRAAAQP